MTASGSEPYFAFVASFARPRPYHRSEVTKADMITSSRLDYVLCCARVAHYLILIATGRFGFGIFNDIIEPDQMANLLNQWIHEYVALDPSNASEDQQAKRPLAEAAVEVEDIAGNPGHYMATVTVRPHYQFEGLPATATVHRVRLFGVNSIHG
jgi:type VI secretion system protein ImpC